MKYEQVLEISRKPLTEGERREVQDYIHKHLPRVDEFVELTVPLRMLELLLRLTCTTQDANARTRRFRGTVEYLVRILQEKNMVCDTLFTIKVNEENFTVPDGLTRIWAVLIHGKPVPYVWRLVTKEQAKLLAEWADSHCQRTIGDRLTQHMKAEGMNIPGNMNKWTAVLKTLYYIDRGVYTTGAKLTNHEYTQVFLKHEFGMRFMIDAWKNPGKWYSRGQTKAAFVYMFERSPQRAKEFLLHYLANGNNVEVHVGQAGALRKWLDHAENYTMVRKDGKPGRSFSLLEPRIFNAAAYCMSKYVAGKPVERVMVDRDYFRATEPKAPVPPAPPAVRSRASRTEARA